MRDVAAKAEFWIATMESGRYPSYMPVIGPDLKAAVSKLARRKLEEGAHSLRLFLERHAFSLMIGDPVLSSERGEIIHSSKTADDLRRRLDHWIVSVWERYPWQEGQLLP
jgi:hypothetical protein